MPYKKLSDLKWYYPSDLELDLIVNHVDTTGDGITVTAEPRCKRSPKRQWFEVQKILRNGPATIVFWGDGTKTVVKRPEGKEDDIYEAFTAALGIKMYKTNSQLKKLIRTKTEEAK